MKVSGSRFGRAVGIVVSMLVACSCCAFAIACSPGSQAAPSAASGSGTVKVAVAGISEKASEQLVDWLKRNGFEVDLYVKEPIDVAQYDGMVLPGGVDIDPALYGQEPHKKTEIEDTEGDKYQVAEAREFIDAGLPVLGVCRGCQIVNIALGGTLEQHIKGRHDGYRDVNISPDSLLFGAYGESEKVWHYHHQCIDVLGKGLFVTQTDAEDGRIEAIEHETLPVYGVQWHPEVDKMRDAGDAVAQAFKEVCIAEKAKRASGESASSGRVSDGGASHASASGESALPKAA